MSSNSLASWLVVVPARLASERLPRKPLQDLGGLPMIVRVFRNLVPLAEQGAHIVVATDAEDVRSACLAHDVTVEMTKVEHPSGTDRCWEVAARHPHPFIMNVQGDEPFAHAEDLVALAHAMETRTDADMGSLVYEVMAGSNVGGKLGLHDAAALAADPNTVKAVRTDGGFALYFSRAGIPYDRDASQRGHRPASFLAHMGIYAFRRSRLAEFVSLPPSPLERTEKLEQLRALESGWRIHLTTARFYSRGIDTLADLEAARALVK